MNMYENAKKKCKTIIYNGDVCFDSSRRSIRLPIFY